MLTLGFEAFLFYALAMAVLFIVPGPVWVMLIAQSMQGGLKAGLAIALGVAIGDLIWPVLALVSLNQIASVQWDLLGWLRWLAAAMFCIMGVMLALQKPAELELAEIGKQRKTALGFWAGILAGLAVVVGNPKAVLFYLGILPGFFDIAALTLGDMIVISCLSALVPFIGNIMLAGLIETASRLLHSPTARIRLNRISASVMIAVGGAIFAGVI